MKDMYAAIEKHHREIRLAHLTGIPKDLLEQAKRDTKFFFILVKLLNESLNGTQNEQKNNLREVYSWYVGNKHTLASAPRFGKQKSKKEKKVEKSISPTDSRPVSSRNKLGHVADLANRALEMEYTYENFGLEHLQNSSELNLREKPREGSANASVNRQSSMSLSAYRSEVETPDSSVTKRLSEPQQPLLPRRQARPLAHLFNPHARDYPAQPAPNSNAPPVRVAIQSYTPGDKQSPNIKKWYDFQQQIAMGQDTLNLLQYCGRSGVAGGQRYVAHENGLAAEQYTQEIIAQVALAAPAPPALQPKPKPSPKEAEKRPREKGIPLEKQSLEDFYKTTQGYYPAKLPKYPNFRLHSAPHTARQMSSASVTSSPRRLQISSLVGFPIGSTPERRREEEEEEDEEVSAEPEITVQVSRPKSSGPESQDPSIKFNTVVSMIDSVTDEMTLFKEKLFPEPLAGFRTPVVTVNPDERPQTAPSLGSFARLPSPLDPNEERASTSLSASPPLNYISIIPPGSGAPRLPEAIPEHDGLYPASPGTRAESVSSGYSRSGSTSRDDGVGGVRPGSSVRSFTTEDWQTWRERFLHEQSRYKWQATSAGGHAYYRRSSVTGPTPPGRRSVGRGPSGSRPKTAPQTPRERWDTAAPNEENQRVVQAATHTTTEVDPEVMESMFAVRRLGGKNAKQRRYRFFLDYRPDSRDQNRSTMTTPAMEYLTFIAPKPVAGSRASSAVVRSRGDSAMDSAPHNTAEEDMEADDDDDSLTAGLDLPEMDDLDDDLDDNFQYEGDAPLDPELEGEDNEFDTGDVGHEGEEEAPTSPVLGNGLAPGHVAEDATGQDMLSGAGSDLGGGSEIQGEGEEEVDNEGELEDFDSVNLQSSSSGSRALDIEQQCTESRQLIQEIEHLVNPTSARLAGEESRGERRPVSSHSRVTFGDEVLVEQQNGGKSATEGAELGQRRLLKPKSILVPRHIQPPPSVGLTIRQFHGGSSGGAGDSMSSRRAFHAPSSAPTARASRNRQVLSQSAHWSYDVAELSSSPNQQRGLTASTKMDPSMDPDTPHNTALSPEVDEAQGTEHSNFLVLTSGQANQHKPRFYTRAFPKPPQNASAEFDTGLKVEGMQGGRTGGGGDTHVRGSGHMSLRSAGVSPIKARSASHFKMLQKQQSMLRRAPSSAKRSAPSIPTDSAVHAQQVSAATGPFSAEHDIHARRHERSPRRYMEKVGILRRSEWGLCSGKTGLDGYLTNTLRVSRVQSASRTAATPEQMQGHPCTPVSYFSDQDRISEKSEESESATTPNVVLALGSTATPRSARSAGGAGTGRLYVYSGRPIPDYARVQTPEEKQAAELLQRQAAAAVSIQKNFRGYVARRDFGFLLREERHRREDQQHAAQAIQRAYRAHLRRMRDISARPTVSEDTLQWAREFKRVQQEKMAARNARAGAKALENSMNKARTDTTLAVIGPHVEVYMPFHPKKTGAKKEVLHAAATCLQRHLKGWLIRKKFTDLRRKAKLHASSWGRFREQYRELIRRVQIRHGISRPKIPFSFQQVSQYMDLKRRYESAFESRAFAGELELDELIDYFRECDLYPVQSDVDEAIDVVLRGQTIKKGLAKHQVLELTFYLYPPAATGITHTRRSTWTNPIVDGEEGNKLLVRAAMCKGSELLEPTDFDTAWKLVSGSIRERKEREEKQTDDREATATRAKLDAIKKGVGSARRRSSTNMQALQEEEDDEEGTESRDSSAEKQRDKRVTFTDQVTERHMTPRDE